MEFFHGGPEPGLRVGVLAGAFNPPTQAHVLLAEAALDHVDQVIWTLPRLLPHKPLHGAMFEQRIAMLCRLAREDARYSVAASDGGLFLDIARECQKALSSPAELLFICGRDAAQRVIGWDYGRPGALDEMLAEFKLLVAGRKGDFHAPTPIAGRVRHLALAGPIDQVSSTEVRERIARGEAWEHLVPGAIASTVERIYSRASHGR